MASIRRCSASDCGLDRARLREERLKLIKQRHSELILRPRDGLMTNLSENDGFLQDFEERDDMALLAGYELREAL